VGVALSVGVGVRLGVGVGIVSCTSRRSQRHFAAVPGMAWADEVQLPTTLLSG
jgi:hypothetical protein